jgi:hypoxanthine phosphoribosyltransferase
VHFAFLRRTEILRRKRRHDGIEKLTVTIANRTMRDTLYPMQADIDRVLISRRQIADRVRELAERITADHSPPAMMVGEITIVPILTGAVIFCADLIRHMPLAMKIGLITVSSYPGTALRSQGAQLLGRQLGDIRGRHVLLVDDILDSGGTLRLVTPILRQLGPASVKTCVLLRKDRPAAREVHADYVGFDIPDQFVVGYGLDYDDYYRNLPEIVTLRPAAMGKSS